MAIMGRWPGFTVVMAKIVAFAVQLLPELN